MDVGGVTTLGGLVALIAANQLVRFPIARRFPFLFWLIFAANGIVALFAMGWGLPGLVATANWIVAALFLYHLVQNLQTRAQWFAEERAERREALYAERERMRALEEEEEERKRLAAKDDGSVDSP
jgi:signal transduction histidine kinase